MGTCNPNNYLTAIELIANIKLCILCPALRLPLARREMRLIGYPTSEICFLVQAKTLMPCYILWHIETRNDMHHIYSIYKSNLEPREPPKLVYFSKTTAPS